MPSLPSDFHRNHNEKTVRFVQGDVMGPFHFVIRSRTARHAESNGRVIIVNSTLRHAKVNCGWIWRSLASVRGRSELPRLPHHEVEVNVQVDGRGDAAVVVDELFLRHHDLGVLFRAW